MIRSLIKFSATGLGSTGLHILVAAALIQWQQQHHVLANGMAFLISNALSFYVNSRWSFSAPITWHSARRFFFVSAFGGLTTVLIAAISQHVWNNHWIGIGFVVLLVPPVTYLLHYFFTFAGRA